MSDDKDQLVETLGVKKQVKNINPYDNSNKDNIGTDKQTSDARIQKFRDFTKKQVKGFDTKDNTLRVYGLKYKSLEDWIKENITDTRDPNSSSIVQEQIDHIANELNELNNQGLKDSEEYGKFLKLTKRLQEDLYLGQKESDQKAKADQAANQAILDSQQSEGQDDKDNPKLPKTNLKSNPKPDIPDAGDATKAATVVADTSLQEGAVMTGAAGALALGAGATTAVSGVVAAEGATALANGGLQIVNALPTLGAKGIPQLGTGTTNAVKSLGDGTGVFSKKILEDGSELIYKTPKAVYDTVKDTRKIVDATFKAKEGATAAANTVIKPLNLGVKSTIKTATKGVDAAAKTGGLVAKAGLKIPGLLAKIGLGAGLLATKFGTQLNGLGILISTFVKSIASWVFGATGIFLIAIIIFFLVLTMVVVISIPQGACDAYYINKKTLNLKPEDIAKIGLTVNSYTQTVEPSLANLWIEFGKASPELFDSICQLKSQVNEALNPKSKCAQTVEFSGDLSCIGKLLDEPGETVKLFKAGGKEVNVKKSVIKEIIQAGKDANLGDATTFTVKFVISIYPTESIDQAWRAVNSGGCVGIAQFCAAQNAYNSSGASGQEDFLNSPVKQMIAIKKFIDEKRSLSKSTNACFTEHFKDKTDQYKIAYLWLGGGNACPDDVDGNGTKNSDYGASGNKNFLKLACNDFNSRVALTSLTEQQTTLANIQPKPDKNIIDSVLDWLMPVANAQSSTETSNFCSDVKADITNNGLFSQLLDQYFKENAGKQVDDGNGYSFGQCVSLIKNFQIYLGGSGAFWPGNNICGSCEGPQGAIEASERGNFNWAGRLNLSKFPDKKFRFAIVDSNKPEAGDIVLIRQTFANPWGHTGVATGKVSEGKIEFLEQNRRGSARVAIGGVEKGYKEINRVVLVRYVEIK
jgi:CHAP domain